jgi:uncharacterized protein (DUF3084 family)
VESENQVLERRSHRLTQLETSMQDKAREIEARHVELRRLEGRITSEADLAEERSRRLEEHDRQLQQREADLKQYVARVQGSLRLPNQP